METLTIVCWKWKPFEGYRSHFTAEHVNILASMVSRNCSGPYEVVCVTDDPVGIDSSVRTIPLWDDYADVPSPADRKGRRRNPSCYRRLKMFSRDAGDWLGQRILSLDLDVVITDDIYPLVGIKDDWAAFGDTHPTTHYNGGLILFKAGSRPQLWEDFDPIESPPLGLKRNQFGSDQAWMGACLGRGERKITTSDGIYSYRCFIRPRGGVLPDNARIVLFHGQYDPWHEEPQKLDWVRRNYR